MSERRLTLVRHAEAAPPGHPPIADFDRPLTRQGRLSFAARVSDIREILPAPDQTLASPALRTRQTAEIFLASYGLPGSKISPSPDIYEAPPQRILAAICTVPDQTAHLLVVGHNPGISLLATTLSSGAGDSFYFGPGTIVSFEILVDSWTNLSPGMCRPSPLRTP